jgi:hypothetical protein
MTKDDALKEMDEKIIATENSVATTAKGSIMHTAAGAMLFAQRDARKLIEQIDYKPNAANEPRSEAE